ncbi:MAG: SEL1-like repeat protein [Nitratireductor sp.]|nr:SEL1-like repeat protein [Nitratireductor sp.]
MSRIRSHLDMIAADRATGSLRRSASDRAASNQAASDQAASDQAASAAPRQAYPPAPGLTPAPAQEGGVASRRTSLELDAIHRSLDDLTARISAMPRQAAASLPVAAPRPAAPQAAGSAEMAALRGELNRGLEQMRAEMNRSRQEIEGTLTSDLKRIADGIATLQQSSTVHPDYVDAMQAELRALKQGVEQISYHQASAASAAASGIAAGAIDLSDVSRSIESGYSEIVNKLDQVLAQRGSELPEIRLPDYMPEFRTVQERLAEVSRAVVSMSVAPQDALDQHALERIEARLQSLAKAVNEIQEAGGLAAIGDQPDWAGYQESVVSELARLSERLDAMHAGGDAHPQIVEDIQALATRIDGLQGELGLIAAGVEGLANAPAAVHAGFEGADFSSNFRALEESIAQLAGRFDALGSGMADGLGENPNGSSQEILSVLRDLVGRVEAIERIAAEASAMDGDAAPGPGGFDQDRLSGLENQLSAITAQLGSLSAAGGPVSAFDMSPITERLDNLEGQIAASRDIAIDIANDAAQKAIGSAGQGAGLSGVPAGMTAEQSEQIDTILAELRLLRAASEEQPSERVLGEIGRAIQDIQVRLADIGGLPAAPLHAAAPDEMAMAAADLHLPELDAPSMAPEYAEAHPSDAVDTALPAGAMQHAAEADTAGSAAHSLLPEQPEGEAEDIPLEPGSGMPDLEALVRMASDRKRGAAKAPNAEGGNEDDGINELMAAARRAARAASQQTSADLHRDDLREGAKPPKGRRLPGVKLPGVRMPVFGGRKALMLTAAAVVVAVAGWVIVPKFLGNSHPAAVSQSVEPAASEDMASRAADSGMSDPQAQQEKVAGAEPVDDAIADGDDAMADDGEAMDGEPDEMMAADGHEPANDLAASGEDDAMTKAAPGAEAASIETEGKAVEDTAETANTAGKPVMDIASLPKEAGNEALLAAAASGNGNALFEIARRYTEGEGVTRDLSKAAEWYLAASKAGHAPAQYRLGNFYENGHGVEASIEEAAKWYATAAAAGNALAMHNLAVLNVSGKLGSDPDMETAIGWFEKAANLGVKNSQVNLGILYTRGMGVEADLEQAYKWFAIAAKGGDNDAASKRDTVAKNMRPDQLERARGEAELWQPAQLNRAANVAHVRDEWKQETAPKQSSKAEPELVRQTQYALGKMGYDAGPADGIMGAKTEQAIRDFQKSNGLKVNGKITQELVNTLAKLAA